MSPFIRGDLSTTCGKMAILCMFRLFQNSANVESESVGRSNKAGKKELLEGLCVLLIFQVTQGVFSLF